MNIVNLHNDKRLLYIFKRDSNGVQSIEEVNDFYPYYYVSYASTGTCKSYTGQPLRKILGGDPNEMRKSAGHDAYESDVSFPQRYLIDKVDTLDKTAIKFGFFDVEMKCSELPSAENPKFKISCISVISNFCDEITTFFLPEFNNDEELMLQSFAEYLKLEAFDILMAWNIDFDIPYLSARWERLFGVRKSKSFAEAISPVGKSRYGKDGVMYPIGTSIVDYLSWFKKITLNKEEQYTLDHIAKKHLGVGKTFSKVDFNKISDEVKYRNQEDVQILMNLENKFKLVEFHDEIRRLSKVDWESMTFYSRVVDNLLLMEAKQQKVVLPNKPVVNEDEERQEFEGAYRVAFKTGKFNGISAFDIGSAYPWAIINFCLDPANVRQVYEEGCIKINDVWFKQNDKALLPTIMRKAVQLKSKIKNDLESCAVDTPEYKENEIRYAAIKSCVNAHYGTFGMRFFRLFDLNVAGGTTWLVRSLLHFVQDKLAEKGYEVLYIDTDSVYVCSNDNLTDLMNNLIKEWGQTFGKPEVNIQFAYEGVFEKILILAKCRYVGYLRNEKGELKKVVKGVEMKRKDCFDGQTKVLTDKGWTLFKDLTLNDKVLSLNPHTNLADYYPIKKIICEDYTGTMFNYNNTSVDFCVTPNHQFLQRTAQYSQNDHDKFKSIKDIKHTKTVFTSQKYFKWTGVNLGSKITLTGLVRRQYNEKSIDLSDWFELLGWYLSEGNVYINEQKNIYEIDIAQSENANPDKCRQIEKLLLKLGIYFYRDKEETKYQIKDKLLALELNKYGKHAENKLIPTYAKQASPDLLQILLDAYCAGDGYIINNQKFYTTSSKQMAHDLHEIICKTGISATIQRIIVEPHQKWIVDHWANVGGIHYKISENSNKFFTIEPHKIKTKYYKGKIYCVEVEPHHTIFVMRNGKSYWSGNSSTFMKKFQTELIELILNDKPKGEIIAWIKEQEKKITEEPLSNVAFPCKISKPREAYKNVPIFLRAIDNTPEFKPVSGSSFYYIYADGGSVTEEVEMPWYFNKDTGKKCTIADKKELMKGNGDLNKYELKSLVKSVTTKKDVLAFDDECFSHIETAKVNWPKMISRNIHTKIEKIFVALGWKADLLKEFGIKVKEGDAEDE